MELMKLVQMAGGEEINSNVFINLEIARRSVVFPSPFLPTRPYRLPNASSRFEFDNNTLKTEGYTQNNHFKQINTRFLHYKILFIITDFAMK